MTPPEQGPKFPNREIQGPGALPTLKSIQPTAIYYLKAMAKMLGKACHQYIKINKVEFLEIVNCN
jgi:hypothetical protein